MHCERALGVDGLRDCDIGATGGIHGGRLRVCGFQGGGGDWAETVVLGEAVEGGDVVFGDDGPGCVRRPDLIFSIQVTLMTVGDLLDGTPSLPREK